MSVLCLFQERWQHNALWRKAGQWRKRYVLGSSIHVDVTLTVTVSTGLVEHVIVADGNGILQIPQISNHLSISWDVSCPTSNPCNLLFNFPHPLPWWVSFCSVPVSFCWLPACLLWVSSEGALFFSSVLNSVSPARLSYLHGCCAS